MRFTIYDDSECEDIAAMNAHFRFVIGTQPQHLTARKLAERHAFMAEELKEFKEAADAQDLTKLADALVDLVVFAKGTAVMLGLPWQALWADVMRANLSKERGVGPRGFTADLIKPSGWEGPRVSAILERHGYDRTYWTEPLRFVDDPVETKL